ncbi:MAG TPA: NAD(P)-dependent oxidoreductase [Chloroflexota bacterium]|nr:NAD(P)-dependent oxidoreductase [Chloroflexota bacterium]
MGRKVGFIGLGHMGQPMARRLLGAGFDLTVYNRNPAKVESLRHAGAAAVDSPAEVAARSEIVFSMIADDVALKEVALGEHGVLTGARAGLIYVDMSTVSPAASAEVADACSRAEVQFLRAPVTGSTTLAEAGALGILASGPRQAFDSAADAMRAMGSTLFYLGPGDEARHMKLALNTLIGTTMAAFAEALVLGEKAGLEWGQMLEVFAGSAAGSPLVKYKAQQLANRDLAPAFSATLMRKDYDLALAAARDLDVATPLSSLSRQLFQATIGSGWGALDFAAVLLFIEQASGMRTAPAAHG